MWSLQSDHDVKTEIEKENNTKKTPKRKYISINDIDRLQSVDFRAVECTTVFYYSCVMYNVYAVCSISKIVMR